MFKRFAHWAKVVVAKSFYVVSHPRALWKERREELRARMWAREMAAKEAGLE